MRSLAGSCLRLLVVTGAMLTTSVSDAVAQASGDPGVGDAAAATWSTVSAAGDTGCAFDTPFRFFVHEGPDPSKLLVWFQGGGACWEFVSCSGMFDTSITDGELRGYGGIFAFDDPENPLSEYSAVFIPYCTGDVHVGDASVRYGEESWDTTPVRHRGWSNVGAVLAWMSENVAPPDHLVIAGASAGAYGALFHAPNVAGLFPGANVVVIGDSGVPLLDGYPAILERWGASARLRELWGVTDPDQPVTLEAAHREVARRLPGVRIAQLTSNHDGVQSAFYLISGSPAWREATFALLGEMEQELPTFRAFVVDGNAHGLLRDDLFGDREADGVRLRAWVADLVNGRPVRSRYCAGCRPPR